MCRFCCGSLAVDTVNQPYWTDLHISVIPSGFEPEISALHEFLAADAPDGALYANRFQCLFRFCSPAAVLFVPPGCR